MVHLVQISNGVSRRVAMVEEPRLRCLEGVESVYDMVQICLREGGSLSEYVRRAATGESLDYDDVYHGRSRWHLLPPIDVPGAPSRMLISGTGLTHLGSAKERQAMHAAATLQKAETMTDSMRIFQWGVESGRPAEGTIGIAPEWFYKGNGSILRAPFEPLTVPPYGEDGGDEAELAGIYFVGPDGTPHRIGITAGNEFSDHKFEKRNYLNLAGSKLRTCSLGPELVVGAEFGSISGEVSIERGDELVWHKAVETGEDNMCHSLANLEHHHFKFEAHRQPGDVHVHFFGAHSLSFGDGVELHDGDSTVVRYEGFGRALRNSVSIQPKILDRPVKVNALA